MIDVAARDTVLRYLESWEVTTKECLRHTYATYGKTVFNNEPASVQNDVFASLKRLECHRKDIQTAIEVLKLCPCK